MWKRNKIFRYPYIFSGGTCKMVGIFDDFSKFHSAFSTLHFEKSLNMANILQKLKKSLVQLVINSFLPWYCGYPFHHYCACDDKMSKWQIELTSMHLFVWHFSSLHYYTIEDFASMHSYFVIGTLSDGVSKKYFK